MSQPIPPAAKQEQPEGWQLLRTHLTLAQGFSFIIVIAPDAATLATVRDSLPTLLQADKPWRHLELDPGQPADFLGQDILRFENADASPQLIWVDTAALALTSPELMREHWEQAFTSLNRRRNHLADTLHGTLAIAGTPELLPALREFAPDLWAIRSALIHFQSAPDAALAVDAPAARLQRCLQAIMHAFRSYDEIGIDNFAYADQQRPDIWNLFVPPACSTRYLRPEDIETAQTQTPAELPITDLLPKLATPDHRRTVLLADPGMGKSTLIQSLIAILASGRHIAGAPELTGLFPIPIILRDLVPLMPAIPASEWTWQLLIETLLRHYRREEKARPLFHAYTDHPEEIQRLIHEDARVFFFIDGLDEIGSITKRREIVRVIHEGMLAVNKEARWLITSRIIGYEEAPVEVVKGWAPQASTLGQSGPFRSLPWQKAEDMLKEIRNAWCGRLVGNDVTEVIMPDGAGYSWRLSVSQKVYLAPFDDQRQMNFARRWFQLRKAPDYSTELFRELSRSAAHGVRVISRVPNLLCFMVILKRSGKPLPDGRAVLYEEIVKAYLSGIDSAYRLSAVHGHDCPFDPVARRELLSYLAAHMQRVRADLALKAEGKFLEEDGSILISMPELQTILLPLIQRMQQQGRVTRETSAETLLRDLLEHIARRSGLLIPRGDDPEGRPLFGFTHLSFLEYFAALWLNSEFQRQRNRFARLAEAAAEGHEITSEELDREFPLSGPYAFAKGKFPSLAALTVWHEVLIFVAEMNASAPSTLLRWLFPFFEVSLSSADYRRSIPIEVAELAIKLAQDREINLPVATRCKWWQVLWRYHFYKPTPEDNFFVIWALPSLLLNRADFRSEVLSSLFIALSDYENAPLLLNDCPELTAEDLEPIQTLQNLTSLALFNCQGLTRIPELGGLKNLQSLDIRNCRGLSGQQSLEPISRMTRLQSLFLMQMDTEQLPDLSHLGALEVLVVMECGKLTGAKSFPGLPELKSLRKLMIFLCENIGGAGIAEIQKLAPEGCEVVCS